MMRVMVATIAMSLLAAIAAAVTAEVGRETVLYALEADVLARLQKGESAEIVERLDGWYRVAVPSGGAAPGSGLVAMNAVVRRGNRVEALRATAIYAKTRAEVARIPAGGMIEIVREVRGGYVARYAEDGETLEGLVRREAVKESEALTAWREELAAAVRFERLYERMRMQYALVGGEFVKLPAFDLSRASSDPEGGAQLPAWEVGAFGYVPWARIEEVFKEDSMLAEARIYVMEIVTTTGGNVGTFGGGGARGLEPARVAVKRADKQKLILTGWPTENVADGHVLWEEPGLEDDAAWMAIIRTQTYKTPIGAKVTVLQAIPLRQVRRGLNREEVRRLMAELEGEAD